MKKNQKKNHTYAKWILLSVVLIGAITLYHANSSPSSRLALSASSPAASEAPHFTVTDIDGRPISLTAYRGKVVILDFWAPWCPPCKREIPDLISLQNEYGSKGLQIIGIGLDEPDNVASFVRLNGINYPVAVGDDKIANQYGGITGIPTTFIIDKNGNIAGHFEGFTERTVFERAIRKLL